MNNQHAGLSQTLADQHITGLRDHATRQRLKLAARQPRRPHSVGRSIGGNHVQTHTRTLILGATLVAMNLAGLTAVAHAQAHDPDGKQGRRPATERQVGETWREPPLTAQQPAAADAALQRVLSRERFSVSTGPPAR